MGKQSEFSIVPRVVWQGQQPREIKIYCALASYVDWETGVCWPSRTTIAELLGVSVSTVDRALTRLAASGVIKIEKRTTKVGDRDSNLYRLPFAINTTFGGSRSSAATWPQNGRQGGRRTDSQTRVIEQQGLTLSKLDPGLCKHLSKDDTDYCTACDSMVANA